MRTCGFTYAPISPSMRMTRSEITEDPNSCLRTYYIHMNRGGPAGAAIATLLPDEEAAPMMPPA